MTEVALTTIDNLKRPEPQALASALEALAARFGNKFITSQAVREQHAHTTTWLPPQPPDAVVMAQETADIQDTVRICAKHGVPVIAFGAGDWKPEIIAVSKEAHAEVYVDRRGPTDGPEGWQSAIDMGADGIRIDYEGSGPVRRFRDRHRCRSPHWNFY